MSTQSLLWNMDHPCLFINSIPFLLVSTVEVLSSPYQPQDKVFMLLFSKNSVSYFPELKWIEIYVCKRNEFDIL